MQNKVPQGISQAPGENFSWDVRFQVNISLKVLRSNLCAPVLCDLYDLTKFLQDSRKKIMQPI